MVDGNEYSITYQYFKFLQPLSDYSRLKFNINIKKSKKSTTHGCCAVAISVDIHGTAVVLWSIVKTTSRIIIIPFSSSLEVDQSPLFANTCPKSEQREKSGVISCHIFCHFVISHTRASGISEVSHNIFHWNSLFWYSCMNVRRTYLLLQIEEGRF